MGLRESLENQIEETINIRDIKTSYIRKLNNVTSITIIIFVVAISLYFYLSYQTQVGAINTSINIIAQALADDSPIGFLKNSLKGISTLYYAQLLLFLLGASAFVITLRVMAKKYTVIKKDSLSDALTKTYNKKAILFALKREILRTERYGHPTTVAILDIDYFKKYNDTNGHIEGDNLLKRLAHIIKDSIREYDIFGRFGGEEFIIIFPETKVKEAYKICERLREKIENEKFKGRQNMPKKKVTVSIGLAEVYGKRQPGKKSLKASELLDDADELLYKAKESGRNQVIMSNNGK